MKNSTVWWAVGTVLVVVGLIVVGRFTSGSASAKKTNREVALICTTDMATQFHIHPTLQIVINGKPEIIPTSIGVTAGCMNPLHTHDTSGMIHVESPEARDFTLADLFAVWGKTFTKDQILDSKADDTHSISVKVNGVAVDTFENTVLKDTEHIVISYGTK